MSQYNQDVLEIYSEDGELIAKREEKSVKDVKIEELEKRMKDLADEITELKIGFKWLNWKIKTKALLKKDVEI